jgi:hypothetical protein
LRLARLSWYLFDLFMFERFFLGLDHCLIY